MSTVIRNPLLVTVEPGTTLTGLLDQADTRPVVLEHNGRRYRLDRLEDGSDNDVAASIAGIRGAAGSWNPIDAEAFKTYVAERRRTARRPSVVL